MIVLVVNSNSGAQRGKGKDADLHRVSIALLASHRSVTAAVLAPRS